MKACLTPEYVDKLCPPESGEFWIGDNHLEYFGVRGWAGKKGGNIAFAIRLRDQFGFLVRETFRPDRDDPAYRWKRGWEKSLGYFLGAARRWAVDRIAIHRGFPTLEQRRWEKWERQKKRILATTLKSSFDRRVAGLRKKSANQEYVDHIQNLISTHIPDDVLASTFRSVPVRRLADCISAREISYGNVRVFRSFVGSVFKEAGSQYAPLRYKLESIQRRCLKNLDARKAPPYPAILEISADDYRSFFAALEADENWRAALAIRLYFSTGAKLQQILKARWSDIIENRWYPFLPRERKLWYECSERLDPSALAVLALLQAHHRDVNISSPYLFPSSGDPSKPIRTIQRHWGRFCGTFGWNDLPISHVVLRHRGRTNPSYSLDFYRSYLNYDKTSQGLEDVSKVGKRRENFLINSRNYMVERLPSQNLIA